MSIQERNYLENIQKFGVPVVVALNSFISDTEAEYAYIKRFCRRQGVSCTVAESTQTQRGEAAWPPPDKVLNTLENRPTDFRVLYEDKDSKGQNRRHCFTKDMGADGVSYSPAALKALKRIEEMGFGNLPVCMAKTQYSLSDDQTKLGRPSGFTINKRCIRLCRRRRQLCGSPYRFHYDYARTSETGGRGD